MSDAITINADIELSYEIALKGVRKYIQVNPFLRAQWEASICAIIKDSYKNAGHKRINEIASMASTDIIRILLTEEDTNEQ